MFPHVLISVHLSPLLYLLLWLSADGWLLHCFNLSGVLIVNIKYGHFKYLWRSKVYKVYTTTVKSDSSDSLGFLVKTLNTSPILVFYFTNWNMFTCFMIFCHWLSEYTCILSQTPCLSTCFCNPPCWEAQSWTSNLNLFLYVSKAVQSQHNPLLALFQLHNGCITSQDTNCVKLNDYWWIFYVLCRY